MAVAAASTTRLASATLAYSHTCPYAPKTTLVERCTRMMTGSRNEEALGELTPQPCGFGVEQPKPEGRGVGQYHEDGVDDGERNIGAHVCGRFRYFHPPVRAHQLSLSTS